jgi:hypothetical protein
MIDPVGVKQARPPHQTVDFISLGEQELRKIRAVLPGNAGDQCAFGHLSDILSHFQRGVIPEL